MGERRDALGSRRKLRREAPLSEEKDFFGLEKKE